MTKTVKIKGNKYEIKGHSYRAMWIFEDIAGKKISEVDGGTKDGIMYIYSLLSACNKEFPWEFDEFVDDVLTPELMQEINSKLPKEKK